MSDKHLFALYTGQKLPTPEASAPGAQITITDPEVWHQAANVLRLTPNEAVILFDGNTTLTLTIQTMSKKGVVAGLVTTIESTHALKPSIHLYQGLLKKESFEEVAYCAAQMGATTLTPVISSKIHRMWYSQKDNERLTKIMISACQQAKQFVLPVIRQPMTVEQVCGEVIKGTTILFEPDGKLLMQALTAISTNPTSEYGLILGPEGGFTTNERQQLEQAGAICHALTPTILRSIEAATLALGVVRSVAR